MIHQLTPPLPLVTKMGKGWAHLVIDYSQEHDLLWVVFLDASGECWTFKNADIRMVENLTMGRPSAQLSSHAREHGLDARHRSEHRGNGHARCEDSAGAITPSNAKIPGAR